MMELLIALGAEAAREDELLRGIREHESALLSSAGKGDPAQVSIAEAAARADPAAAFTFDSDGAAELHAAGRTWSAGRFEPVSLGDLRARAAALARDSTARLRLWVLDGASPATDIGSLQGCASSGTVFQVASQFNCLESSGPWVRPVEGYFHDSTQGPRAAISAFPGTLLRHYRAPDGRGGRFVQTTDGPQLDLLSDVCEAGVAKVSSGYLRASDIANPAVFSATLEARFDALRVGVHDEVDAVLGFDWDGAVSAPPPRITQVFTSTVAAGAYGGVSGSSLDDVFQPLLRAAYLGTLLAAASLGRARVVLTLIGGGAFRNPPHLIWEAILWALTEVEPLLSRDLDVVVNGRNLGQYVDRGTLADAARTRGGVLLCWPRVGPVSVHR
jgi:hypothetical protein